MPLKNERPLFELINPSDPYTFGADDFEAVCWVACILGEGWYGVRECNGARSMPVFAGASMETYAEWWTTSFGHDVTAFLAAPEAKNRVLAALDSLIIGSPDERRAHEAVIGTITDPEARERARAAWLESKHSSLNNIGATAVEFAKQLRLGMERKATT